MRLAWDVIVLFVNSGSDAAAVPFIRQRHHRMCRLGERRMIVVLADDLQLRDVRAIEHADPSKPDRSPELVAETHCVMQAVGIAAPGGLFSAGDMLVRHPPA